MKIIREYRTMTTNGYIYEFEINGICADTNPESFLLIKTNHGYVPISETPFFSAWNYAEKCDLEIIVETKFRYTRMERSNKGTFTLIISETEDSNVSGFSLMFIENISRDYQ